MENYIMAKNVGDDIEADARGDAKECLLLATVLCVHILKDVFSEQTNAELVKIMSGVIEAALKDMEESANET